MTADSFRYHSEPLGKRLIAWLLLYTFLLQCAPVWALPSPRQLVQATRVQPISPREFLPKGLPPGVMPHLPNPMGGIVESVQSDALQMAHIPEPDVDSPTATPSPGASATPVPEVSPDSSPTPLSEPDSPAPLESTESVDSTTSPVASPSPQPRRYPVRILDVQPKPESAPESPESVSVEAPTPDTEADTATEQRRSHRRYRQDDDQDDDEDRPGHGQWPHFSVGKQMAVVFPPARLPGEPTAEISRLPHAASNYSALSATSPAFIYDQAAVFKKTYTQLKNPGKDKIRWDFFSPVAEHNSSRMRTSASIFFTYSSIARCSSHRDARYKVEMTIYDNKTPSGRHLTLATSKTHLEELIAYAGISVPDTGTWRWKETRGHQLLSETTFEVKALEDAPATWSRLVNGELQVITAPFIAYTSDQALIRSKEYEFRDFNAEPNAGLYRFAGEWNWKAPADSGLNRNINCAFLTLKTDYVSDGNRYQLVVRAYDGAYPKKGHLVRFEEGAGWLPKAKIVYGVGLPVTGNWQFRDKINGVETENLVLQARHVAVGVESPEVVYLDNEDQSYRLNLVTEPPSYKLKNFKWTLDLRNPDTQTVVRSYTGEITDNAESTVSWEQVWDGKDSEGNLVSLGSAVSAQLRVDIPHDPSEEDLTFEATVSDHRKRHCAERQLEPSRVRCKKRPSGHDGAPGKAVSLSKSAKKRYYVLGGYDFAKGITHCGSMAIYLVDSNTKSKLSQGQRIYQSLRAGDNRWEDRPIRIDTPDGKPPKSLRVEFRDDSGKLINGESSEVYLRASDASLSVKLEAQAVSTQIPDSNAAVFEAPTQELAIHNVPVNFVPDPNAANTTEFSTAAAIQALDPFPEGFTSYYGLGISQGGTGATSDPPFPFNFNFSNPKPTRLAVRTPDTHCSSVSYKVFLNGSHILTTGVMPRGTMSQIVNLPVQPTNTYNFLVNCTVAPGGCAPTNPFVGSWAVFLLLSVDGVEPPVETSATSPNGVPVPVISSSSMMMTPNSMSVGAGPVAVGMDTGGGTYRHVENDLTVATRGLTGHITRFWHSAGDGLPLGTIRIGQTNRLRHQFGWIWSFQRELVFSNGGNSCRVVHPEGGQDAFRFNTSTNSWIPVRADMTSRLTQLDSLRFQIETKGHDFVVFRLPDQVSPAQVGARAFLEQERDMHNNQLNYVWDSLGNELREIRDGTNRQLFTLDWGSGPAGSPDFWLQLRSVTDVIGNRTVTYTYRSAPVPYQHRTFLSQVNQPGNVVMTYAYNAAAIEKDQPGAINLPVSLFSTLQRQDFYSNLASFDLSVQLREIAKNNVVQASFANADKKGVILRETTRQNLMTYRRETSPVPNAQIRVLGIPTATPNDTRAFDFRYNTAGRPTDIWDSQGHQRQFTFDPAANLTRYVSTLGQESLYSFDSRRNLLESRDALGNVHRLTWDSRDRLIRVQDPKNETSTFEWNSQDDLVRVVDFSHQPTAFTYTPFGALASATNALGHTWNYAYSPLGFLSQVTEPASVGVQPVWKFQTDALGRVTAESLNNRNFNTTAYDVRDRVISATLLETNAGATRIPATRTTTYSYNNFDQVVSVQGPINPPTSIRYDSFQRYERTIRPNGTSVGRTYNAQGEVATHFNGAGFSTTYQYDSLHRVVSIAHPQGGGTETFGYDQKGRLERWRKIDGTLVQYTYDQLDRISRIHHEGTEKVRYTYDELSRVLTMADEVGNTRYAYNPSSDLTEVVSGHGRRILYGYDAAHQLVSRVDPENLATQFTRNERGQVNRASYDGLSCDYSFNAHGEVTQALWSTGLREQYAYSSQGESLDRTVSFPGVGNLEAETVNRDGLGRKARVGFTVPGSVRTHSYTYDTLGQLTSALRQLQPTGGPPTTRAYSYDNNFNRTNNNGQTSSYAPSDRITGISGLANPVYDGAGSIQRDQLGANYSYNWRDQLTSYSRPGIIAQYGHDGNNLRQEKIVNGVSTQYLWDGSDVLKEYAGNVGPVKASYFLGATGRQAIKVDGQWYIYLRDTHGSMTGLVDLAGNRVATYESDPYGEPIVDQGTVYNPYRWNGEPLDAESGLTYMRNRYYQASTGRFIQRDPIGYAGGLNLYAFPTDPINSADPSGLAEGDYWDVSANAAAADRAADLAIYNGNHLSALGWRTLAVLSDTSLARQAQRVGTVWGTPDTSTGRRGFETSMFALGMIVPEGRAIGSTKFALSEVANFGTMLEHEIVTARGVVGTLARVENAGGRIILHDVAVFNNAGPTTGLLKEMLQWRTDIATNIAKMFPEAQELVFAGQRVASSTSAMARNRGTARAVDKAVNLARYRR